MTTPQEKIDTAAAKTSVVKRDLREHLRAPAVVRAIADAHPLLATLPQAKREAAALRLGAIAYTAAAKSSALMRCSAASVVQGVVEAAQLGLTVDGVQGHAYLVPYWQARANRTEAQLQIGYRGYIALAYRSGLVERIAAGVVHEHDHFEYAEGSAAHLSHRVPLRGERGDVIGAYAICQLRGTATPLFVVLRRDEVEAHRDRSQSWQSYVQKKVATSPWVTDFEAMARKTALRRLAKWMPQDELQRAGAADEQADHGIDTAAFALPADAGAPAYVDAVAVDQSDEGDGRLSEDDERRIFGSEVTP